MSGFMYFIFFEEVVWVFYEEFDCVNIGYCFGVKGGYFFVFFVDLLYDLCVVMCFVME